MSNRKEFGNFLKAIWR